jgi:arginase
LELGQRVINWGGDHSAGLATVSAFTSIYSNGYVLWIDAHADINTPEASITGNFHGMPMACLLGIGKRPGHFANAFWRTLNSQRLIYLGLRDLDPFEKELIQSLGIQTYSMRDCIERGLDTILLEIKNKIGCHPLHISFDIDSVDPQWAPSTGVPFAGGLTRKDLKTIAKHLKQWNSIKAVDVMEINPRIGSLIDVMNTFSIAFEFLTDVFESPREGTYEATINHHKNKLPISEPRNTPFWP